MWDKKKREVQASPTGFTVKPSAAYQEHQAREQRMIGRKGINKTSITNKELWDLLLDVADRQSEIYDLLKNTK